MPPLLLLPDLFEAKFVHLLRMGVRCGARQCPSPPVPLVGPPLDFSRRSGGTAHGTRARSGARLTWAGALGLGRRSLLGGPPQRWCALDRIGDMARADGGSEADRVVARRIADEAEREKRDVAKRGAREARARREEADAVRREIRAEIPRALGRLEARGFPDGSMLQTGVTKRALRKPEPIFKAAWRVRTQPPDPNSESWGAGAHTTAVTYLVSDGKIMTHHLGPPTPVDLDGREAWDLRKILEGLRRL